MMTTTHSDPTKIEYLPTNESCADWARLPQSSTFNHGLAVDHIKGASPQSISLAHSTADSYGFEQCTEDMDVAGLSEIELDGKARSLFKAFLACPKFLKYRSGTKKADKDVWPDHIEWAFFRALVRIPACGRFQAKKLGRNQRIGLFIEHSIGVERSRKQTSSHLQVLRGYVSEEPRLLGYLIQPKDVRKWHEKQRKMGLPMYPVSWAGIDSSGGVVGNSLLEPEPHHFGCGSKGASPQTWHLREFEMSLCTRHDHTGELGPPLHTYCGSAAGSQFHDIAIDRKLKCFEVLPELYLNHHSRPIAGQVMAVEASIDLPSASKIAGKSELAIYLSLQGPRITGVPIVDTVTTFYQACGEIEKQERFGSCLDVSSDAITACYQIPFCSSFWASTLSRLGALHQRSADLKSGPYTTQASLDESAAIDRRIADEFTTLTAVQQITLYSAASPLEKHHFTLRWQFKSSPLGHVAWRFVSLPADEDDPVAAPLPSPSSTLVSDPLAAHTPLVTPAEHDTFLHSPQALQRVVPHWDFPAFDDYGAVVPQGCGMRADFDGAAWDQSVALDPWLAQGGGGAVAAHGPGPSGGPAAPSFGY